MFKILKYQNAIAMLLLSFLIVSCEKENVDEEEVLINFDCPNLEANIGDACQGDWGVIDENCDCVEDTEDPVDDCTGFSADVNTTPDDGSGNGTAEAVVTGGTAPYEYIWSMGETPSSVENLMAGEYSVQIIDAQGCVIEITFMIDGNSLDDCLGFSADLGINPDNGSGNGNAVAVTIGGTAPFTYTWSGGVVSDEFDSFVEELVAGDYSVTIVDALGCILEYDFIVEDNSDSGCVDVIITTTADDGIGNGTATITVTGGVAPYLYELNGVVFFGENLDNLPAGEYSVSITDADGCVVQETFTIELNNGLWDCPNFPGNIGDPCQGGWGTIDSNCDCIED